MRVRAGSDGPVRSWLGAVRPVWPLALVLLLFVGGALLAPLVAPQDPARQNLLARLKPPGSSVRDTLYVLGTDEVGRDLLSRIVYGARISLVVACLSVLGSLLAGAVLGMMAAYYRGPVEAAIMRGTDIMLSIPPILLAILMVAILGPGLVNLILVLCVARWPRYARVAHGQALGVCESLYVRAARFNGASDTRILARHVTPNVLAPLIVVATLEFGLLILFEAGLSFLGLGVQPPTPSWGSIMSVGRNYMASAWWIVTLPGICLFLAVLSVNLIGDHLRDRFDPRALSR